MTRSGEKNGGCTGSAKELHLNNPSVPSSTMSMTIPITVFLLSTMIKILLFPSYRSTDFDVHRNWLAITHHLPLDRWYHDDVNGTTVHTLDYPPTFAYFESLLSNNPITLWLLRRGYVDERCLALLGDDENDPSDACVVFHRSTVVLADVVLLLGAIFASNSIWCRVPSSSPTPTSTSTRGRRRRRLRLCLCRDATVVLILLNPGLLMLDHVHFQYNGMLLGILLFSIGCIVRADAYSHADADAVEEASAGTTGRFRRWPWRYHLWTLLGATSYALLLTMKHLYLTLAPLYFVHLLRCYCFVTTTTATRQQQRPQRQGGRHQPRPTLTFSVMRLTILGVVTLSTLVLPFLPFLLYSPSSSPSGPAPKEQLLQIFRRLFPFQRGLCHDYWAANVWALYLFSLKVINFARTRLGRILPGLDCVANMLPGEDEVPPGVTAMLLMMSLLPAMYRAWVVAGRRMRAGSSSSCSVAGADARSGKSGVGKPEERGGRGGGGSVAGGDDDGDECAKVDDVVVDRGTFFVQAVVYCSLSAFMLAYHVHEKAIMTAIVPLTLLAAQSVEHSRLYLRTCALGHFGLFPLLFRPRELTFKVCAYVVHLALSVWLLEECLLATTSSKMDDEDDEDEHEYEGRIAIAAPMRKEDRDGVGASGGGVTANGDGGGGCGLVTGWDEVGMAVLASLFVFVEAVHPLLLGTYEKLEFLPLMATSVVCAVGLVRCWVHSASLLLLLVPRGGVRGHHGVDGADDASEGGVAHGRSGGWRSPAGGSKDKVQ